MSNTINIINFDNLLSQFLNNKNLLKSGNVFTFISQNKKNTLFIIDTIYKHTHISFFKDQWNSLGQIHITIGKDDATKCAYYLRYVNKQIIEPPNFAYEQTTFGDDSSRRKKCSDMRTLLLLKKSLQTIFDKLFLNSNTKQEESGIYYKKYMKYKQKYMKLLNINI